MGPELCRPAGRVPQVERELFRSPPNFMQLNRAKPTIGPTEFQGAQGVCVHPPPLVRFMCCFASSPFSGCSYSGEETCCISPRSNGVGVSAYVRVRNLTSLYFPELSPLKLSLPATFFAVTVSRKPFGSSAIQMGADEGTDDQVLHQTDPGGP